MRIDAKEKHSLKEAHSFSWLMGRRCSQRGQGAVVKVLDSWSLASHWLIVSNGRLAQVVWRAFNFCFRVCFFAIRFYLSPKSCHKNSSNATRQLLSEKWMGRNRRNSRFYSYELESEFLLDVARMFLFITFLFEFKILYLNYFAWRLKLNCSSLTHSHNFLSTKPRC